MVDYPKRLNRRQQAEYLLQEHGIKRSPKTLGKLASIGGGPRYQLDGRDALSTPEWLDEWVNQILTPPVANAAEGNYIGGTRKMRSLNVKGPALSTNSNRAGIPIRSLARNIHKSNRKAGNNQPPPIQILSCRFYPSPWDIQEAVFDIFAGPAIIRGIRLWCRPGASLRWEIPPSARRRLSDDMRERVIALLIERWAQEQARATQTVLTLSSTDAPPPHFPAADYPILSEHYFHPTSSVLREFPAMTAGASKRVPSYEQIS